MLFHNIPNVWHISPYGIVFSLSMLLFLLSLLFEKTLNKAQAKSFFLVFAPLSLLLSRLIYVFFNHSSVLFDSVEGHFLGVLPVFAVWKGGLSYIGFLLGLIFSALLLKKRFRISFSLLLSSAAPGFALFFSALKFSQFFAHQGFGINLESGFFPFAIRNSYDEWYLAVFLFEGLAYLALFFYLLRSKKNTQKGFSVVFFVCTLQMFFETLRYDGVLRFSGNYFIRAEMVCFFILALVFLIIKAKKSKNAKHALLDFVCLFVCAGLIVLAEFHEKVPFPTLLLYGLSFASSLLAGIRLSHFKQS